MSDPEVREPLSADGTLPETSRLQLSEPEPAPWGAPAEKSPAEPETAEEAPTWEPAPWALVSGARLLGWAEWAASTTFSSTGLRFGDDKREVDAFRSAVRDTFLGVSKTPVRSEDLRGKQFSTHRPGYDKTQVAAFLDTAGIRLAAMELTDGPAGPLVSGARLALWAEWADLTPFTQIGGYEPIEVDNYRRAIRDTFLGVRKPPVRSDDVRGKQFPSIDNDSGLGYDKTEVDAFIEKAAWRLAAMESSDADSTDASSPTTPTDTPPTTATWPLLEVPALPPAATESHRKRLSWTARRSFRYRSKR